jgi:D-serine deaminase-like pyridoxal phosphate-dependent protein
LVERPKDWDRETLTSDPHQAFTTAPPWQRLAGAVAALHAPFAVVDLEAMDANAADLVRRASGKPIRLASKSLRCREILRRYLERDGFAGILAYTLPEALWLAADFPDVVVAYPSVDRAALRALAESPELARRVTVMVDDEVQLDLVDAVTGTDRAAEIRVCLDLDASLRLGSVHVGARRSPLHTAEQLAAMAARVLDRPGFRLVGVMAYEAQIAGVGDNPAGRRLRGVAVRGMQKVSAFELRRRRSAGIAAVRDLTNLEFVNGGGTGSLERTSAEKAVTELAAGSGLYGPVLFDAYRSFHPHPAAMFAAPVVRLPAPGFVTVAGGGWIASGPIGPDRQPVPVHPPELHLLPAEGAGEVQTPLQGNGTADLRVGDLVWFRHAKAGELCEHVNALHLVDGEGKCTATPTYRGEGRTF